MAQRVCRLRIAETKNSKKRRTLTRSPKLTASIGKSKKGAQPPWAFSLGKMPKLSKSDPITEAVPAEGTCGRLSSRSRLNRVNSNRNDMVASGNVKVNLLRWTQI
ncbi:hypothetical protein PQR71_06815 [Paraburkholderia fungorum]|uniref:hypothetical protein n=1 Tax=Paraburkholderia fungorum TaxID=134537 RepID=UPI0038B91950